MPYDHACRCSGRRSGDARARGPRSDEVVLGQAEYGLLARRSRLHAVDDVSVQLMAGAVTAVVGESGSGKTTVARLLARIVKPDAGEVLLDGKVVAAARSRSFAAQVQMVFQDPFASLNPVHKVRHHLARPLEIHHTADGDVEAAVRQLLHRVALDPPANVRRQVSARTVGWPAPACRDSPSAGGASTRPAGR